MRHVKALIGRKAVELAQHPLFTRWLQNPSIPARHKLLFMPQAIDFVMGFRDFNRYYVRYPEPKNLLEEALNAHAAEDQTHSALFLQDWAALGIDEMLDWAPRDLYWWMTCDQTVGARRVDFELVSMIWHNTDPLMRFAIIEAIEAAGNVFFRRTVPVIHVLREETQREYPYFGEYHLHRETGHLQNTDERQFLDAVLSDEDRQCAAALVKRVFEIFDYHFQTWLELARSMHEGRWAFRPVEEARAAAADVRPEPAEDVSVHLQLDRPLGLTGVAAQLAEERQQAFVELWNTQFYSSIRSIPPGEYYETVRSFLLQWIVDNWSCADYFEFDTTYPDPRTPLERGINRLSTLYASEMKRRYVEWETLKFDEHTGWDVREALGHYWLDPRVEEHREVFADLRKLTFRYPEPLYRYWILKCFVRFGDTFMHSLGVAMRRSGVPDEEFMTFAGFSERLHPDLPPDPEADLAIAQLEHESLSPEQVANIREIIRETRDQEARRSEISWRIVQDRYYETYDRRWRSDAPVLPIAEHVPTGEALVAASRSASSGGEP